jgi:DNA-binding transcriptional ArsR family regulator
VTANDPGLIVTLGPEGPGLVVSAASGSLRQAAGPVAWSALELVALSARLDATGALVVTVGVRELAGRLGVGRDAAANALTRLRELGLVSAAQQRAGGGRFDGTLYTIRLPVLPEPSRGTRARSPSPRRARETITPTSLSLFGDPADEATDLPTASPIDATDASNASGSDHSTQVPREVPKKLHELAFDRMPIPRDAHGSGGGSAGGLSC